MRLRRETMSAVEKRQVMERLWARLAGIAQAERMPDWHAKALEQRRRRIERGETTFSPLDDVKARLRDLIK